MTIIANSANQEKMITQLTNPDGLTHGQKAVENAGTEESLAAAPTPLTIGVTVKALEANNGKIYVGFTGVTAANGFELSPGEQIFMPVKDLEEVFIDTDTDTEGVSFMGN